MSNKTVFIIHIFFGSSAAPGRCKCNKLLVSIQRLFRFKAKKLVLYLRVVMVSIQRLFRFKLPIVPLLYIKSQFQYNVCFGSRKHIPSFVGTPLIVSIQRLFRFKVLLRLHIINFWRFNTTFVSVQADDYRVDLVNVASFNTTFVSVQVHLFRDYRFLLSVSIQRLFRFKKFAGSCFTTVLIVSIQRLFRFKAH